MRFLKWLKSKLFTKASNKDGMKINLDKLNKSDWIEYVDVDFKCYEYKYCKGLFIEVDDKWRCKAIHLYVNMR